jgi:hypothetical protein
MQPIKMIDATDRNWSHEGAAHVPLAYAAPDARRSFFHLSKIPAMGFLTGFICPACGRVVLYGQKANPPASTPDTPSESN